MGEGTRSGAWPGTLGALVPSLLLLALVVVHGPQAGSLDDAFVVWADARDLAFGMWQPVLMSEMGERAAVEGSTSLLDVGLKALVLRLSPSIDPLRAAGWMGLAWLLALLWVVVAAARRWSGSGPLAAAVACLVTVSPGLVESAGYLLEGPLFALLLTLALVAAVDARPGRCAAWGLLLAAARPEGLLVAPLLVTWAGGRLRFRAASLGAESAPRARIPWGWVGVGLLCSAVVTALRWWRFSELLPNTYYAKASDSAVREALDGANYVLAVLWGSPGPAIASVGTGLALIWTAVWSGRRLRGPMVGTQGGGSRDAGRGLLAVSLLYGAGVIVSGGDSYEGARLFMPIALPLWLGLAVSFGAGSPRPRGPLTWAALLVPFLALVPSAVRGIPIDALKQPSLLWSYTGRALAQGPVGLEAYAGDAEVFQAVALALGPQGVFAHVHTQRFRWFEPSTPVLDLTGLTDWRIARLPEDGPVRFGRFALSEALRLGVGAIHLDPQRARPSSIVDAPSLEEALADPAVAGRYIGEPFVDPKLAAELARDYVGASFVLPFGQGFFNLAVHHSRADAFREQGFRVSSRR